MRSAPPSRLRIILFAILTTIPIILYVRFRIPYHHFYNAFVSYTRLPNGIPRPSRVPSGGLGMPPLVNALLCATSPLSFSPPSLTSPAYSPSGDLISPALVMLHIFSANTLRARHRRRLIRRHHPLHSVPEEYKHLVEVRFVLGYPDEEEVEAWDVQLEEIEIEAEARKHGDLLRLSGLEGGENMDHGKTLEWVRWLGRENGSREAWWIIKCDDDMLPILPNLLPLLVQHDNTRPTYLGSHLGAFPGTHYHFEGMMYGFNWQVVKTLATAPIPRSEVTKFFPEDGRSGELMYSLPSLPNCSTPLQCLTFPSSPPIVPSPHQPRRLPKYPSMKYPPNHPHGPITNDVCDPLNPPAGSWDVHPPSPDARTGLVRWDLGRLMGRWSHWGVAGPEAAVGYHNLKTEMQYRDTYRKVLGAFWAQGKEYMWAPPENFAQLAAT